MSTTIFLFFFDIVQSCEKKIQLGDGVYRSYKKRAYYAIIQGFARAGVFMLS